MRKLTFFLSLLLLFQIGISNLQATSLTLDRVIKANQITEGKKIALRGLKNNNPWINIVANNALSVSKSSVFLVEKADGGIYLKNESTGQYLKAYSNNAAIGLTTIKSEAGIFSVSNPAFNTEDDMNWLEPSKDKSLLTRFTSKGTNMFINTQGATSKAIYSAGPGGWSVMYVYDVTGIEIEDPQPGDDGLFEGNEDKFYLIRSISDPQACMAENQAGKLSTAKYENQNKVFWKIIPAGEKGRFYIKNASSELYIQSSKQQLSSQIPMGTTATEFQIGRDMTQGASTSGFYYFCSTDQNNIPSGAIGLNFDMGNSKNIVAWYARSGDKNSYWRIEETAYTYDPYVVPLTESMEQIADAEKYTLNAGNLQLASNEGTLALTEKGITEQYAWVFVGKSNSTEGIYLVNMAHPDKVLTMKNGTYSFELPEQGTRWFAALKENGTGNAITFTPFDRKDDADAPVLSVDQASEFTLGNYRSQYSRTAQIYYLPCGTLDKGYLTRLDITGEHVQKELRYKSSGKPGSYYTLYTSQKATVSKGETFSLVYYMAEKDENNKVYVYFDWNRDGIFETSYAYDQRTISEEIPVPANAKTGKSRMRIRITNNELTDAEDDAVGTIYDFIVNIAEAEETRQVRVYPNDPERGKAVILDNDQEISSKEYHYGDEVTIVATPNDKLEFIAWKDGSVIKSIQATYTFTVRENADMKACFSPNSSISTDFKDMEIRQDNFLFEITRGTRQINVVTDAAVKMIYIYNTDGVMVRKSRNKTVSTNGLSHGNYIIKVVTSAGQDSKKIILE